MATTFTVLRRGETERGIFGGEVYIDIDGRNVGTLGEKDFSLELEPGEHTLKMYKSHTMNSFIGMVDRAFTVRDGERLVARYSAPLLANQAGTIVLSSYENLRELDAMSEDIERRLGQDFQQQQAQQAVQAAESKKNSKALVWAIVGIPALIALLGFLYWVISMSFLF